MRHHRRHDAECRLMLFRNQEPTSSSPTSPTKHAKKMGLFAANPEP